MLVADRIFVDHNGVFQGGLDGDDARFEDRLFIFCVVILAVFGQVAVGAGDLYFFGDFFTLFAF